MFKYRFLVSKCFYNLKMFPNKLKNKINRIQKRNKYKKKVKEGGLQRPL